MIEAAKSSSLLCTMIIYLIYMQKMLMVVQPVRKAFILLLWQEKLYCYSMCIKRIHTASIPKDSSALFQTQTTM